MTNLQQYRRPGRLRPWQKFLNPERTPMSKNTLVWRPVPADPPPTDFLPDDLSHLLMNWFKDRDVWQFRPTKAEPMRLDADQRTLGFLEGLAAMRVEGAAELVVSLVRHQSIELWWE